MNLFTSTSISLLHSFKGSPVPALKEYWFPVSKFTCLFAFFSATVGTCSMFGVILCLVLLRDAASSLHAPISRNAQSYVCNEGKNSLLLLS